MNGDLLCFEGGPMNGRFEFIGENANDEGVYRFHNTCWKPESEWKRDEKGRIIDKATARYLKVDEYTLRFDGFEPDDSWRERVWAKKRNQRKDIE